MEKNTKQGTVDPQTAMVVNEPQFLEFIHEQIDAGPRRTDHLCEHLLGDLWNHCFGLIFLAIASEEKKSASDVFGKRNRTVFKTLLEPSSPRRRSVVFSKTMRSANGPEGGLTSPVKTSLR